MSAADEAWQEAPPRQMLLRMRDIQPAMQEKWLQLYWPDDGKWWPAQVIQVDPKAHKAQLLYETGKFGQPSCVTSNTSLSVCQRLEEGCATCQEAAEQPYQDVTKHHPS